ncbi:MAG: DNA alkylation repair protein [Oscillospiraceae bacterium]|nr:DNA alkylation repair protein [Oscillospiraceae bacterium]
MPTNDTIYRRLSELSEPDYKTFSAKLTPNIAADTVLGVKVPRLRELAKQIYGSAEAEDFMKKLPHRYLEENMLHGMLVERIKSFPEAVGEMERFLPYVDNWAVCDIISPKAFKKHPDELLEKIRAWTESEYSYTVRFGLKMLMSHFLDGNFKPEYLELAAGIRSDEYYVNMMQAWFFATALAKQYDAAIPYIRDMRLEPWVHNKTIQKAIESRRISGETKEYLRTLKVK